MTIFEFQDYRSYLNHIRTNYPGRKKPITLEFWAKKLQYRSPRSIAMVLKGQRLPSEELVLSISQDLQHSEAERRYFELLVRKEKFRGNVPASVVEELEKLNPKMIKRTALDAELFSYVSGWHNYVILSLFSTPGFRSDPAWIAKRLGGKLTKEDVEASLNLLERLKFLAKQDGKWTLAKEDPLITMEDIPSMAGRRHQIEQMDQAKDALQKQPLMDREITSLTTRVSRKKLPQIKKFIREFRDNFDKSFFDDTSEDVCQLNVQFFFHTEENK